MAIVVNGVTLPDIPADVLAQYPYAVIAAADGDWLALVSTAACVFLDMDGGAVAASGESVALLMNEGAWLNMGTSTTIKVSSFPLVWANHDVEIFVDMNDDGTIITDGVYFARNDTDSGGDSGDNNEPDNPEEPEDSYNYEAIYSMPYEWFISMGNHARRLSGIRGKMTVDVIDSALQGVTLSSDLPVAENYPFGGSSTQYGMEVDPALYGDGNSMAAEQAVYNIIQPVVDLEVTGFRALGNGAKKSTVIWDERGTPLKRVEVPTVDSTTWGELKFDKSIKLTAGKKYAVGSYSAIVTRMTSVENVKFNSKLKFGGYCTSANTSNAPDLSANHSSHLVAPVDIIIGETEVIPDLYQVSLSTMNAVAMAIQNALGVSKAMTPAEMIAALQGTASTAEE